MFIIDAVSAETRGQTALPSPGDSTCMHSLLRPGLAAVGGVLLELQRERKLRLCFCNATFGYAPPPLQ